MIMKEFDPIKHIENSNLALDGGQWPNFHDAEVHNLNIWGGTCALRIMSGLGHK